MTESDSLSSDLIYSAEIYVFSCKCQDKSIFSIFVNFVLNFSLNICSDVILKLFLFVNRYFQVVLVCIS